MYSLVSLTHNMIPFTFFDISLNSEQDSDTVLFGFVQ